MDVVATKHQKNGVGVALVGFNGDLLEVEVECLGVVVQAVNQAVVGEFAGREHLHVLRGKHDGACDAVGAMQLAYVAVCKDVTADDDGLEMRLDIVYAGSFRHRASLLRERVA